MGGVEPWIAVDDAIQLRKRSFSMGINLNWQKCWLRPSPWNSGTKAIFMSTRPIKCQRNCLTAYLESP
jgi:hypothetical protein